MKIIETPSPNFNERPTNIDAVIIHYTDMVSAEAALAWLVNPASQVSAHYLIDEAGHIYRMVHEEKRAWHAGESAWLGCRNMNDCSIGIELANPGHSHGYQPFPTAQIDALITLCLALKERWNIPSTRFLGHSDIAPHRKQDPGHLFPWVTLAREGLGLWPVHKPTSQRRHCEPCIKQGEAIQKATERLDCFAPSPSRGSSNDELDNLVKLLSQVGYDVHSPEHALLAFQRHFQPHKIDGVADNETYTLLKGLLHSQKMLI